MKPATAEQAVSNFRACSPKIHVRPAGRAICTGVARHVQPCAYAPWSSRQAGTQSARHFTLSPGRAACKHSISSPQSFV